MTDTAIFHLMPGRHMGDAAISLLDFAHTFAAKTNSLDVPDIHPAGAVTVVHWIDEMLAAAEDLRFDAIGVTFDPAGRLVGQLVAMVNVVEVRVRESAAVAPRLRRVKFGAASADSARLGAGALARRVR